MAKWRKDYDRAVELYNAGLSTAKVAIIFGVLPGTMRGILKRRGVIFRLPPKLLFGEKHYWFKHGLKVSKKQTWANNSIQYAIRDKKIAPQPCECCGIDGTYPNGRRKVQAHHDDYEAPLSVRWLCKSCHHWWHVDNKPVNRNGTQA